MEIVYSVPGNHSFIWKGTVGEGFGSRVLKHTVFLLHITSEMENLFDD